MCAAGQVDCGADAIVAIGELSPDLVFLDIGLPDLDGFDVIQRLAADKRLLATFKGGQQLNRNQETPQCTEKLHKDWMTLRAVMFHD